MKRTLALLTTFVSLVWACSTPSSKINEEEKRLADSVSKLAQRRHGDSLKRLNPLLILPPDSDYTGSYVDKYPNGIVKFSGYFRFGERHGQWMSFHPNGLAWSELHFDKGLRHGPNLVYFMNGQLRYTGFYKNDLKDSVWCYYDSTGVPAQKLLYKDNILVKELPLK